MDEQQIREEQGLARRREQQRERRGRARAEETPEQREQRVARRRQQDKVDLHLEQRKHLNKESRGWNVLDGIFLKSVIVSLQ